MAANTSRRSRARPCRQLGHVGEEEPGLGALDDAVVVGRGEGDDGPDAELGQAARGSAAWNSAGYAERAHADDRALAGHQPRHRLHRAERAGVGERDRGAGEVVGRRPCPCGPCARGPRRRARTPRKSSWSASRMTGTRRVREPSDLLEVDGEARGRRASWRTTPGVPLPSASGTKQELSAGTACERPHHREADEVGEARPCPPRCATRCWFKIGRLTWSSLAGTVRTLVAVGTPSDAAMFAAMRAAAPEAVTPLCGRRRGGGGDLRGRRGADGRRRATAPVRRRPVGGSPRGPSDSPGPAAGRWRGGAGAARWWAPCRGWDCGGGHAAGHVVGEELAPALAHRRRVAAVLLEHVVDQPGVRAETPHQKVGS